MNVAIVDTCNTIHDGTVVIVGARHDDQLGLKCIYQQLHTYMVHNTYSDTATSTQYMCLDSFRRGEGGGKGQVLYTQLEGRPASEIDRPHRIRRRVWDGDKTEGDEQFNQSTKPHEAHAKRGAQGSAGADIITPAPPGWKLQ